MSILPLMLASFIGLSYYEDTLKEERLNKCKILCRDIKCKVVVSYDYKKQCFCWSKKQKKWKLKELE